MFSSINCVESTSKVVMKKWKPWKKDLPLNCIEILHRKITATIRPDDQCNKSWPHLPLEMTSEHSHKAFCSPSTLSPDRQQYISWQNKIRENDGEHKASTTHLEILINNIFNLISSGGDKLKMCEPCKSYIVTCKLSYRPPPLHIIPKQSTNKPIEKWIFHMNPTASLRSLIISFLITCSHIFFFGFFLELAV